MLEVMNVRPAELSRPGGDSAMILNCWEKTSPLIRELERTVNFAERKCGDLMQQLHFYKEYYEKWVHAERSNKTTCQKKRVKKCYKHEFEVESSSENEFERVNKFFYKKIQNKITEMNNEISHANRKLHKHDDCVSVPKNGRKGSAVVPGDLGNDEPPQSIIENKICKSEPAVVAERDPPRPVTVVTECRDTALKVVKKQSSKSVPVEGQNSKGKDFVYMRRRYPNLQRYKLRSKSLPQGVRRKFGFGSFIEVFDPAAVRCNNVRSKSRTSLKMDTYRSFKTFKSDGQVKTKLTESKTKFLSRIRRTGSRTTRSLQLSKTKIDSRGGGESRRNFFTKDVKSESGVPRETDRDLLQEKVSRGNLTHKVTTFNTCRDIVPSGSAVKPGPDTSMMNPNFGNLSRLISKPNSLIPFLRQPIPFIPCSSTSKTFNLGLNVQQVLSLIKHRRHSVTLQTVIKNGMRATRSITEKVEPAVSTLFFSHSQVTSALCPAQTCLEDGFSVVTNDIGCRSSCALLKQAQALRSVTDCDDDTTGKKLSDVDSDPKLTEPGHVGKLERPEDVWVVDQPDNNSRECKKSRSRCTCYPSKHCVDYHKVLREYTRWRVPPKPASLAADPCPTYNPVVTCHRPKLCSIPSQEDVNWNLRGQEGKIELMKVHNDLMNLNRRYTSLEEQIVQKNLDEEDVGAELDAMESEVSIREMEFKDIMNFYQDLLQLKGKLKTLRAKNVNTLSQTTISQQPRSQRPKKDPLRPTPSMALTKVLRKIQGLQDKIKLIDAP